MSFILDKPKCFFVQACRGSTLQSGISHDSFLQNKDANKTDAIPETVEKIKIPVDANLLIVYATTPGMTYYKKGNGCGKVPIPMKNIKQVL